MLFRDLTKYNGYRILWHHQVLLELFVGLLRWPMVFIWWSTRKCSWFGSVIELHNQLTLPCRIIQFRCRNIRCPLYNKPSTFSHFWSKISQTKIGGGGGESAVSKSAPSSPPLPSSTVTAAADAGSAFLSLALSLSLSAALLFCRLCYVGCTCTTTPLAHRDLWKHLPSTMIMP